MKTYLKSDQNKKGFTLIELLIVIAIIGLLATLAIVSLTTAQRKARDTKRIADMKQLQNAVELYYSENSYYPSSWAATWTSFSTAVDPYITNVPIDPTNTGASVYTYATNAAGTASDEYVIRALLEQTDHTALTGDDDVIYNAALWPGIDATTSAGTDPIVGATVTCSEDTSAGGIAGSYCVSE